MQVHRSLPRTAKARIRVALSAAPDRDVGNDVTARVELRRHRALALLTEARDNAGRISDIALQAGFFRYFAVQPVLPLPIRRYAECDSGTGPQGVAATQAESAFMGYRFLASEAIPGPACDRSYLLVSHVADCLNGNCSSFCETSMSPRLGPAPLTSRRRGRACEASHAPPLSV